MYQLIASWSLLAITYGVGDALDPTGSIGTIRICSISGGAAGIGWVLGAIAQGVNK